MTRFLTVAARLGLAAIPSLAIAIASPILFQGTFTLDDDVTLIPFAVTTPSNVTIQSYGYAGGTVPTSSAPTDIPAGGFAANAVLFDDSGTEITSDNGGHCDITSVDPITGNCDDPYILEDLAAGSYTLALLEWDNVPTDGVLTDGFTDDGDPGFTCAEFGFTGNFCDVTTALGTVRTGNYAISLDITAASAATPEPTSIILSCVGVGLIMALLWVQRKLA
jgi:hypothetical protein